MKQVHSILLAGIVAMTSASTLAAKEYRKCPFNLEVSGAGLTKRVLPESDFVAWARQSYASEANKRLNDLAQTCACRTLSGNRCIRTQGRCAAKSANANPGRNDQGLSGYKLRRLRGQTILKDLICNSRTLGKDFQRSSSDVTQDKRVIGRFRVAIKYQGGGKGRCDSKTMFGPLDLTVYCKRPHNQIRNYEISPNRWVLNRYLARPNCKRELIVGMRGTSRTDAEKKAAHLWSEQADIQFGRSYADWNKAIDSVFRCRKALQGQLRYTCLLHAKPCDG